MVAPELLEQYEGFGYWLEEKIDGNWCFAHRTKAWSRLCNEIRLGDRRFKDRAAWTVEMPPLVGELKDKKLHVFDTPVMNMTYLERREWLKNEFKFTFRWQLEAPFDMELLPAYSKGFRDIYEAIVEAGGEGVVLKHEESFYSPSMPDRKTPMWVKVKPCYSPDYKGVDS